MIHSSITMVMPHNKRVESHSILVIFLGEPQLKPIESGKTDLMFAVNTNWDVVYDTPGQRYYLLN